MELLLVTEDGTMATASYGLLEFDALSHNAQIAAVRAYVNR